MVKLCLNNISVRSDQTSEVSKTSEVSADRKFSENALKGRFITVRGKTPGDENPCPSVPVKNCTSH
ncbi:Uncharacterized protein dnm_010260 [Desulfonema magnum]|uniref:Uncharacterized protein n=1 Tax=Desulfonema magnum TaxID=45655 RepID=A0A975BGK4_9BACT|nr:Uncharacterized protein dnm_010260 [Desulfonema magnum]